MKQLMVSHPKSESRVHIFTYPFCIERERDRETEGGGRRREREGVREGEGEGGKERKGREGAQACMPAVLDILGRRAEKTGSENSSDFPDQGEQGGGSRERLLGTKAWG